MENSKHIWRAVILLLGGAAFIVSGRHFLVPESFGKIGHFRYDSIGEYRDKPVMHGNDVSCQKCHADQFAAHEQGKHQAVRCENCHGPVALHADKDKKIGDARVTRSWELCAYCHQPLASRPKDFPQVNFRDHMNQFLAKEGLPPKDTAPPRICFLCHDPHDPLKEDAPTETPTEAPTPPAETPTEAPKTTEGGTP